MTFCLVIAACSNVINVPEPVAAPTTTVAAAQETDTSTESSLAPTTTVESPPPTIVNKLPTNGPAVVQVDFDESPGASASELTRLTALEAATSPASVVEVSRTTGGSISPDGTRLAVPGNGELCTIELGDLSRSCFPLPEEFGRSPAGDFSLPLLWSPDNEMLAIASGRASEVWVFEPRTETYDLVSSDDIFDGEHTPLAWTSDSSRILVARWKRDRDQPGDIALVRTDGTFEVVASAETSHSIWLTNFGAVSDSGGLLLAGHSGLGAYWLGTEVEDDRVLVDPVEIGADIPPVAVTNDASTIAFVSAGMEIFQERNGPTFIVDTATADTYELPGEPTHVLFDPTNTWVATVTEDATTEPPSYAVHVAPIAEPELTVEVFRSNADEFFARAGSAGRREPGRYPPAPRPVWTDDDVLLIPLTQQGTILAIELGN